MQLRPSSIHPAKGPQTIRFGRSLWVLACFVFSFILLAASSPASAAFKSHTRHGHVVSCSDAGARILQASDLDYCNDWENDTDEGEESAEPVKRDYIDSPYSSDLVPVKTVGKTAVFSRSVPLFVLFHAWKDYLS